VLPGGRSTDCGLGIEIDAVYGHRRLHHVLLRAEAGGSGRIEEPGIFPEG
jgi:hypothetical protein